MTLQTSGPISLSQIAAEEGVASTNISLLACSTQSINPNSVNRPDGQSPHSMSEFYGYHDTSVKLDKPTVQATWDSANVRMAVSVTPGTNNPAGTTYTITGTGSGGSGSIVGGGTFYDPGNADGTTSCYTAVASYPDYAPSDASFQSCANRGVAAPTATPSNLDLTDESFCDTSVPNYSVHASWTDTDNTGADVEVEWTKNGSVVQTDTVGQGFGDDFTNCQNADRISFRARYTNAAGTGPWSAEFGPITVSNPCPF